MMIGACEETVERRRWVGDEIMRLRLRLRLRLRGDHGFEVSRATALATEYCVRSSHNILYNIQHTVLHDLSTIIISRKEGDDA
jgi:hypothetical protein